jgi:Na+/proline symporter
MTSTAYSIDIGILVVFLVANLVLGLRYGRSVKTLRDYALGGKNFSTSVLVATIVATWMSGSGLFINLDKTYKQGLYYVIPNIIGTPVSTHYWICNRTTHREILE